MFKIELDYLTSSKHEPRYTAEKCDEFINRPIKASFDSYLLRVKPFAKYYEKLKEVERYGS